MNRRAPTDRDSAARGALTDRPPAWSSRAPTDRDTATGGGADRRPAPPVRADPESRILELAARQHGVVARAQLLAAGITAACIDHRVQRGRFKLLIRGVYQVGPIATARARELAAVLACGPGSVLSHRSAGRLWGMLLDDALDDAVDVVVRGEGGRLRGVRRHRATLEPDESVVHDGVPVTTPERTLIDLAVQLSGRELERVVARAEREGTVDRTRLAALLGRHARHRGARRLRRLLDGATPPAFTRSAAEERFLALVRRARLASPATNVMVHGFEVDFYWRNERFVVEIDGHAYHAGARAFERDRRRDAELTAAGMRVMRVTWQQLSGDAEAVLARVAETLALARAGH